MKQDDLSLIPAQTKCFFLSSGIGGRNLMDQDMINSVILRIQVDQINNKIPSHAI